MEGAKVVPGGQMSASHSHPGMQSSNPVQLRSFQVPCREAQGATTCDHYACVKFWVKRADLRELQAGFH